MIPSGVLANIAMEWGPPFVRPAAGRVGSGSGAGQMERRFTRRATGATVLAANAALGATGKAQYKSP